MFPECVAQPCVERHLLVIASAHEVRLAGKQALRRSKPDKILRGFDLRFEMFVLGADVRHSLLRGMRLPVADESGVGGLDSMRRKATVCSSDSAARGGTALRIVNKTKTGPTNAAFF
jgi:hypothetical protein